MNAGNTFFFDCKQNLTVLKEFCQLPTITRVCEMWMLTKGNGMTDFIITIVDSYQSNPRDKNVSFNSDVENPESAQFILRALA